MRTLCICLPERPEQIEAATKHFQEAGVENLEWMWGLDSSVSGLDTSHCYEIDAPNSGFRMGPKPVGIWLAHWTAMQVIMRMSDDHVLVLETDAKFHDGWKEKFEAALKIIPSNYDFLHIGHCCLEGFKDRKHIGGDVWETKRAQCSHAYVIRRACIPFVLKTLRKVWAPIDIQIQMECFPNLRTYAVMPRLVSQHNTELPP